MAKDKWNMQDTGQALSFIGTVAGGINQYKNLKSAGNMAERQGEINARVIKQGGNQELKALGQRYEQIRGKQLVAMGASGVSVDSKSYRQIEDETFDNFMQEAMDIVTNTDLMASAELYKGEAEAYKYRLKSQASAVASLTQLGKNMGGLATLGKKLKDHTNWGEADNASNT